MFATGGRAVANAEHTALLALVRTAEERRIARHRVTSLVEGVRSATAVVEGRLSGFEPVDATLAADLRCMIPSDLVRCLGAMLDRLASERPDVHLVTVLDDDYPSNLRQIHDRTPLLFTRGSFGPTDRQAVAVVGTRRPSEVGLDQASRMAKGLSAAGVTVVSGLAAGIDTAAHRAALEAGGHTIGVLGHGIALPTYPRENEALASQIAMSGGAVVSQFWPTAPPTRITFPIRNVTTSGLSAATVVVEAGETSGARQQARKCIKHGKQLFLLDRLVTHQAWARSYAERPGVVVVRDVGDVLSRLNDLTFTSPPMQLVLG